MDTLGLEQPKTLDELKTTLQAFKDNNMGGENTIPLTFTYRFYEPIDAFVTLYTGKAIWANVIQLHFTTCNK